MAVILAISGNFTAIRAIQNWPCGVAARGFGQNSLVDPQSPVDELAEVVGRHAATMEIWENAELCVIEALLLERLGVLGLEPKAELGVALMAVAQLLAERAPEWGGDARDALAEVAVLGLRLLGDD